MSAERLPYKQYMKNKAPARVPRRVLEEWTVITPAFKAGRFIKECLSSIPDGVEVLIGLDGCRETLEAVPERKGLRMFMCEGSSGPYLIRNTLAELAGGKQILFFDADDYLFPDGFADLSVSRAVVTRFPFLDFEDGSSVFKKSKLPCAHGCFAVDRNYFLSTNGFHPWPCASDTEWKERCDDGRVRILKNPVFARRRHKDSLTRNSRTGLKTDLRKQYRRIYKTAGKPDKLHTVKYEEISCVPRKESLTNCSIVSL